MELDHSHHDITQGLLTTDAGQQLLVILVDVTPVSWLSLPQDALKRTLECLLLFANMYLTSSRQKRLLLRFINGPNWSDVYTYSQLTNVREQALMTLDRLKMALVKALESIIDDNNNYSSDLYISNHISRLLCCAKKFQLQRQLEHPSVSLFLILPPQSPPPRYIPIMNAIFAAQRIKVIVDIVQLAPESSSKTSNSNEEMIIQQLAILTSGLFFHLRSISSLPHILSIFLGLSPALRKSTRLPQQASIDLRPTCFCHGHAIDFGFVCSVCLSVFCRFSPVCGICKARFEFTGLKSR